MKIMKLSVPLVRRCPALSTTNRLMAKNHFRFFFDKANENGQNLYVDNRLKSSDREDRHGDRVDHRDCPDCGGSF